MKNLKLFFPLLLFVFVCCSDKEDTDNPTIPPVEPAEWTVYNTYNSVLLDDNWCIAIDNNNNK